MHDGNGRGEMTHGALTCHQVHAALVSYCRWMIHARLEYVHTRRNVVIRVTYPWQIKSNQTRTSSFLDVIVWLLTGRTCTSTKKLVILIFWCRKWLRWVELTRNLQGSYQERTAGSPSSYKQAGGLHSKFKLAKKDTSLTSKYYRWLIT